MKQIQLTAFLLAACIAFTLAQFLNVLQVTQVFAVVLMLHILSAN